MGEVGAMGKEWSTTDGRLALNFHLIIFRLHKCNMKCS